MSPDPGLQQERTQLAWRRTILTFCVVGLAVVRGAYAESSVLAGAVAVAVVVLALLLAGSTVRRGRWTAPSAREPGFTTLLRDGSLPGLVTGVAGLLAVAVVLVAVG